MMEFHAVRDVSAPPEKLFPYLADPDKRNLWMQATFGSVNGFAKTEYPNGFDEAHAVGTKFVDVTGPKHGNLERRLNGEILEYDKPSKFSFRSEIPYFYKARTAADVRSTTKVTFTFMPNGSGGTTVTWDMLNESSQSLGILNPIMKYFTEMYMKSGITQLEKLARK